MIVFGLLRAFDFCCFGKLVVDLSSAGLVHVTGLNGDGKSTLFRALCWGLYGKTVDGEDGDKVIRSGAKEARVEVSFSDHFGASWRVTRMRSPGLPLLAVSYSPPGVTGDSPVAGSKDVLQGQVCRALGMDFGGFRNSVLYSHGDVARFSNPDVRDSDRKAVLHKMLGTEILEVCHEWAKAESAKLRASLGAAEVGFSTAAVRLSDAKKNLADAEADRDKWDEDREKRRIDLLARARDARRGVEELAAPDLKLMSDKLRIAKEATERQRVFVDRARLLVAESVVRRHDASEARAVAGAALDFASQKAARLEADECPTCGVDLKDGAGLEAAEAARSALEEAKEAHHVACAVFNGLHVEVVDRERAVIDAEALSKECRMKEDEASRLLKEAEGLGERRSAALALAKSLLEASKEEAEKANPCTASVERARGLVADLEAERTACDAVVRSKSRAVAHHAFWTRGFGGQGLPSYVLDGAVAFLTERANHYLSKLSEPGRRVRVEFTTQRELTSKKGEVRDEIAVKTHVGDLAGYPLSRGQQKRLDLASGFALMDLAASRGGEVGLLLLDEVLDGLDEGGRAAAVALLAEMRERRPSVLVISHEADIGEVFERRIVAERGEDGGASVLREA